MLEPKTEFSVDFDKRALLFLSSINDEAFLQYAAECRACLNTLSKRQTEKLLIDYILQAISDGLSLPVAHRKYGKGGEPLWPAGLKGSVTHCLPYGAVALSSSSEIKSIGVDIEKQGERNYEGIAERVLTKSEQLRLPLEMEEKKRQIITLFSIKETIYKTFYPLVHTWFGFKEVENTSKGQDTYTMKFVSQRKELHAFSQPFSVHYQWSNDIVLTYLLWE